MVAACGCLLTAIGARRLEAFTVRRGAAVPRPVVRVANALDGSTDWLVLPGLALAADDLPDEGPGLGTTAGTATARNFAWLAAVCSIAAESAMYGGIAAAGQSADFSGIWPLAVMAIGSVAVAEMIAACRGPMMAKILAPPTGVRVLLAVLGLVVVGPRLALFTVLTVEILSISCTLVVLGKIGSVDRNVVLACRDDGAVARWAGRLVQGNLIPLPPVLAGVIATTLLAALGLRGLPGFIALTPPVVMMLAAPGASHPHDGRFDWLVPVLLVLGQYIYLAALGFALAVPGPVVFAACALTAVWYASLTADADRVACGVGWEARMFVPGIAATIGLATFGYVGLASYLGVLISRKVVIGYLIPREEDRG